MHEPVQVGKAETRRSSSPLPWRGQTQPNPCRYYPPFPALPTTLVELELLLGGQSLDLAKIVSVIRRDPGFAAEVVRLARSYEDQRPLPLETCLIHLGTRTLRRAARMVPVWTQPLSEAEVWKLRWRLRRTRFVALAAETISMQLCDLSPETAYLAGLLHDLPALVCLSDTCSCSLKEIAPSRENWNLPDYLVQSMRWHRQPVQADPQHVQTVRRVAVAREWVNKLQISATDRPAALEQLVVENPLWQHLPNKMEVLQRLATKVEEWQHAYSG